MLHDPKSQEKKICIGFSISSHYYFVLVLNNFSNHILLPKSNSHTSFFPQQIKRGLGTKE